ncbi:uncharacterized protein B0I36DRAFT_337905, partial [Microdochium trichocladiopsis]
MRECYFPASMQIHVESGLRLDPADWKLKHSLADWDLIEKAVACDSDTVPLSDGDRQRLLDVCGTFWGRALGQPASLTPRERRIAKGWPSEDVMATNVAKVAPGLTPEVFLAKVAKGADWMTLAQTDLIDQRFNLLRPGQRRTWYSMAHFDRYRAGWLLASAEERDAYRNSQLRGQLLRRPGFVLDQTALNEKAEAEWERNHSSRSDLRDQPPWIKHILMSTLWDGFQLNYGFPVYFTSELHAALEEKLVYGRALYGDSEKGKLFESPVVFIASYLRSKIFQFGNFIEVAKQECSSPRDVWIARRLKDTTNYIISYTPLPQDDGARIRYLHRMVRYGGALEEGEEPKWKSHWLDEQYFVVLDASSLPPVSDILNNTDNSTDVTVWLYDVDWDPPRGATHDNDGYAGRVKVSLGYHLYVGLYPFLLRPGFTLKKVWAIKSSDDYMYRIKDFSAI